MSSSARKLVMICAIVTALAWGRLLWNTITTADPAHHIEYIRHADGARLPFSYANCHGAAYVDGEDVWRLCHHSPGEGEQIHLTRFDLAAHEAVLMPALPELGHEIMSVRAVARHPKGGVVLVAAGRVLHATREGVRVLAKLNAYMLNVCLRWDEETLELAYFDGGVVPTISRVSPEGAVSHQAGDQLSRVQGVTRSGAGCRLTAGGHWRFVWSQIPETLPPVDSAEVQLLERGLTGGEPEVAQRLTLGVDRGASGTSLRLVRGDEGDTFLRGGFLDSSGDFSVRSGLMARPPLERREGRWVEPSLPPGVSLSMFERDYVVTDEGLVPLLVFDGQRLVRTRTGWVGREIDEDWETYLVRLGPDFKPEGAPGPPVVDRFWLSVGYKMLPDGEGGHWLTGSAGAAVVHVDAALERTDHLGFFGRFIRAFEEDRAKRNSDFYYGAGWLHRVAFLWILFGALCLVLPQAVRIRRGASDGLLKAMCWVFLVGAGASAWSYWALSGVFW